MHPPRVQKQSRAWTVTDYNLERLETFWKEVAVKRLWIGRETCPTTGREHLQIAVVWLRPYRHEQLKKLIPGAHLEAAAAVDCENYVLKEKLVYKRFLSDEDEVKLVKERARTNADFRGLVVDDIKKGVCNFCLADAYPVFMFQFSDKVGNWRYFVRYGCYPPWRKEQWCQLCGFHRGEDAATHDCLQCSRCNRRRAPPGFEHRDNHGI